MILLFDARDGVHRGLARALIELGQDVITDVETDLGQMRAVRARVVDVKPDVVVIAGTIEDPSAAERNVDRVFRCVAEAAIHVAAAAREARAIAVMLSTAEVYGQSGGPFDESDTPEPSCEWAKIKLRAETFLLRAAPDALVLRTGPILSDGLVQEQRLLASRVEAAPDVIVSPIGVEDVAEAIVRLTAARAGGVFHLASGDPPPTHAEWLREAAIALGLGADRVVERPGRRSGGAKLGRSPALIATKVRPHLTRAPRSWRESLKDAARTQVPLEDEVQMGHRQEVRRVDKPWGHEIIWAHAERYVGKILFIKAGERLSLQYHEKKDETVYVLSGKMVFEVGAKDQPREDLVLKAGDSYRITPYTVHRMVAIEDTQVLEASTPELDDVVRLEDKYGREGTNKP